MKWVCAHCLNQTASIYAYLPLEEKNTTSPKLVVILSRKLIVFKGIYPFKKECPCAFKEKLHLFEKRVLVN